MGITVVHDKGGEASCAGIKEALETLREIITGMNGDDRLILDIEYDSANDLYISYYYKKLK